MKLITEARNANLKDLREALLEQHARKVDIVAPANKLRFRDGQLIVSGIDPVFDAEGVTDVNGQYRPTEVFDEGLSEKLSIPLAYVRRMRKERPDLYDANANGLLRGKFRGTGANIEQVFAPDQRSFLVRTFRGDNEQTGIARALLSDKYARLDNLDALTAALDGIVRAGVQVEVDGCDLTDRRMYVRIKAPFVTALAPALLEGYKSPFSGQTGTDNPTVFAGLVLSNSETGDGAFSIVPRMIVQVCSNGMTIQKDAMKAIHLGGRMDEGTIRWTSDTQDKQLALITAKARDAVATFLDVDYMRKVIRDLTQKAGKPIEGKLDEQVKLVTKKLGFDEETQDRVFDMFVKGGQFTAGGVLQAVTAAAHGTKDADKAADIEAAGLKALELAFAL
jgi:Domain of unknown function (DUF932)